MQKPKNIKYARRANALLLLHYSHTANEVARFLWVTRSAIQDWWTRLEQYGEIVLVSRSRAENPIP